MTWDYRSVAVTRGAIPGSPRDIPGLPVTWDYRSVAVARGAIPGSPRDICIPGTSQDFHDLGIQECSGY